MQKLKPLWKPMCCVDDFFGDPEVIEREVTDVNKAVKNPKKKNMKGSQEPKATKTSKNKVLARYIDINPNELKGITHYSCEENAIPKKPAGGQEGISMALKGITHYSCEENAAAPKKTGKEGISIALKVEKEADCISIIRQPFVKKPWIEIDEKKKAAKDQILYKPVDIIRKEC